MNLHAIANAAIVAVNPNVTATLRRSTGYTTAASGKRTPVYAAPVSVSAQVQALTTSDLRQMDALNIQGADHTIYFNGRVDAIVRQMQKGGDLVDLSDDTRWKVVHVLETWPDWCKIACTQQMDGT